MNIYRLDPIEPGHSCWQYSKEKNRIWACAPTPKDARDLVATKTRFSMLGVIGARSPWQDEAVTSCVLQPSMTHMSAGDVVREDGSPVDYTGVDAS